MKPKKAAQESDLKGSQLDHIESLLLQLLSERRCPNPVFSIDEVAQQFNVTRPTVYTWIGKGLLTSFRVGGRRRVTEKALERFKSDAEKSSAI